MYQPLNTYIKNRVSEYNAIPASRKTVLEEIAQVVTRELNQNQCAKLVFICTHNSRRSQFGQLWAATAAAYFGVDGMESFSGGTEATAFHPNAVNAAERAGFTVEKDAETNSNYKLHFATGAEPIRCFSKVYDHASNPQKGFIALMTCNDADENCPVVLGAASRFKLTYTDPKLSDGTSAQNATYDERCAQIATEMLYLFSKVVA